MLAADVVGHSSQPVVTDVALWFVGRPTSLNARLTGSRAALPTRLLDSSAYQPPSYPILRLSSSILLKYRYLFLFPPIYSPFFIALFIFFSSLLLFSTPYPDYRTKPVLLPSDFFQPSSHLPCNSPPPPPGQPSCLLSTACRLSTRLSALLWFPSANTVNSYWPVCRHVITLN